MKIVLQKVSAASVSVEGQTIGAINTGYVLLVGAQSGDTEKEAAWLAQKIANIRLFTGENGKMNDQTIIQVGGGVLVVSQFTLLGSLKGGNRPDYSAAAAPELAAPLIDFFASCLREEGVALVECGRFGAHMIVTLTNDGPVTLLLERTPEYHSLPHGPER